MQYVPLAGLPGLCVLAAEDGEGGAPTRLITAIFMTMYASPSNYGAAAPDSFSWFHSWTLKSAILGCFTVLGHVFMCSWAHQLNSFIGVPGNVEYDFFSSVRPL